MKEHVAIVIKNENNETLFIKRSIKKKTLPGIWSFPSGTIEKGEGINDTAIREANEELGINVGVEKLLATKDLPELSVRLYFVLCRIKNGEPFIKGVEEIDKFEWMSFSDFFNRFSDNEIGHGLMWLRKNPGIWKSN